MKRSPRPVATTLEGFVQYLACNLLPRGWIYYSTGTIPEGKDPEAVDKKLSAKYEVDLSKAERARRKAAGVACVRYVRHERFFVLVATKGKGRFFEDERFKCLNKSPLRYMGYSISHRGGHAHVRIEREQEKTLKAHFVEMATRKTSEQLGSALYRLPFEPYAPVRNQVKSIRRHVNRARKAAGLGEVSFDFVRMRRRPVKVFE